MPRRFLGAIGALLIASALAAGSGANYQSSSANTGNIIKAGVVSVTSSVQGSALLNVSALRPGRSVVDTVDVSNSGDLPATMSLRAANVADVPASPALSDKATLKVEDLGDPACVTGCPAASTVYEGKLGSLGAQALGRWPVGDKRRFRFTVSLSDGGLGAENAYQGARTTLDLTWSAAQV
jgi:hypothetical protein